MGSKMKQDKAVTSPQPTPARNADRKWRFDAVCEALFFWNIGGQIWHHGVHAGVRCDITVSGNAGLKPFSRRSRVVSIGVLPILDWLRARISGIPNFNSLYWVSPYLSSYIIIEIIWVYLNHRRNFRYICANVIVRRLVWDMDLQDFRELYFPLI